MKTRGCRTSRAREALPLPQSSQSAKPPGLWLKRRCTTWPIGRRRARRRKHASRYHGNTFDQSDTGRYTPQSDAHDLHPRRAQQVQRFGGTSTSMQVTRSRGGCGRCRGRRASSSGSPDRATHTCRLKNLYCTLEPTAPGWWLDPHALVRDGSSARHHQPPSRNHRAARQLARSSTEVIRNWQSRSVVSPGSSTYSG